MKKYVLLLTLCTTLLSCNTENTSQIKPSSSSLIKDAIPNNPKSQEPNTPVTIIKTPTPTPSPTEKPDFSKLDVYGEGIYCEDRNKIVKSGVVEVKLDKPVNIAVTRDGSAVYVVNGKCGRKPYLNTVSEYLENSLCSYPIKRDIDNDTVENNLIIKITKDGKKQAIIGDNSGLFFCSNDGVIALDENDNLYFSSNRRIYKVKDDKYVELVVNLDELEKNNKQYINSNGMIRTLLLNDNNMYIDVEIDQIPKRSFYTTVTENLSYDYDSYEKEYIGILRKISLNTNSNMEDLIQFVTKKKKGRLFINDNIYISSPIKIKSESIPNYNFGEIIRIPTNTISKVNISKVNLAGFPPEKDSYDIISNSQNDVFVSYLLNNYIIKFSQNGLPKVFVGKVFESGYKDGDGENALFNKPAGMAIDANDNIYVADTGNNAIRKITPDGTVSTFYKEL